MECGIDNSCLEGAKEWMVEGKQIKKILVANKNYETKSEGNGVGVKDHWENNQVDGEEEGISIKDIHKLNKYKKRKRE